MNTRKQVKTIGKRHVFWVKGFALLFLLLFCMPAQAKIKTTYAKKYQLKNVMNAVHVDGSFKKENGGKAFVSSDGTRYKNRWINLKGKIYYLGPKGHRVTGWVIYRNRKYFLRNYVLKANTWFKAGKNHYYAGQKGFIITKSWINLDGTRYYVDENGVRVTGEQLIGDKWYFFKNDGTYDPNHKVEGNVDPTKPMIALTFDDGPGPYTDRLLNCLQKYHARATFFMVGTAVPSHAATVKRMVSLKCELGNHSDSHPNMANLDSAAISAQFSACTSKIRAACGKAPTVCRLPYGTGHNVSRILQAAGLPSIYWSVDTNDWANTGNPSATVNNAVNSAKNGAIILMHDVHYSTVVAAETIIPTLINRGYQLVTVSELARYKGKTTLTAGKSYYNFY